MCVVCSFHSYIPGDWTFRGSVRVVNIKWGSAPIFNVNLMRFTLNSNIHFIDKWHYSPERPFLDFWAGPWFSGWTFWTPVLCLPKYPFGPWSPVLLWQETPAASLAGTAELGGRITVPAASLPRSIDSHEGMGTKVAQVWALIWLESGHRSDTSLGTNDAMQCSTRVGTKLVW